MPKFQNTASKFLKIVILLIITPLVLSACSLLTGSKEDQVANLEFWGLWSSQNVMDAVISDYKSINPNVNISYKKRTPQQYRETIENQIASGGGPDIFVFHNTWVPMLNQELDAVPSEVISDTEFKNTFYPVASQNLRSGNTLVGIPLEYDGLALYYNEDIFKAAGIAKPPSTWIEFAQTAAKLTVKDSVGNIRTSGAAMGTASNVDHFSDILGLMIIQNGGDPKSPSDKQSADALEYFVNFARGENRVWDETRPASTVAFTGGQLAMYFAPSWRALEIKNANPLLNFKTAPVPQLEGRKVAWANYWATGVSKESKNKKAAWDFVKYLQSDEVLIKMYQESAKTPGRFFGEPYPKSALGQQLTTDPIVGAFVQDAPYAQSFPMASRTFDNGINDQIIKAYEDAINQVARGSSTQNALETTANNISQILSKFNAPQAE